MSPPREAHPTGGRVDGRTARRQRNSDAVLDAVHELFVEGQHVPTVDEVAARAGVSLRSIYRYFPDLRTLMVAALARRTRVAEPWWHLDRLGEGPLEERLDRFATHVLDLYDKIAPTVRAAYALAPGLPAIADQVAARKALFGEQVRGQFAPELARLRGQDAQDAVIQVELLAQFESLELLLRERRLPQDRVHDVLTTGIRALVVRGATGPERPTARS